MKKTKSLMLSLMVGVTLLSADQALAGGFVSHHYHRPHRAKHVHHVSGPRYVRHVHARPVVYRPVYRPVYYRPVVQPVIAHYHHGLFDPCYDDLHTTGVYWNVNVNNGGVGFSIGSGW